MATISNTPRPGYVWDSTDNVWYPIGVGGHGHPDYITQATAVNPTIIDAKGDIITATAADTPARLAVGNNGETLVADSSTSTGLRYQAPKTQNALYNSGFDIAQRGTSFTGLSAVDYTLDRWVVWSTTASQSNYASQQSIGNLSVTPNQAIRYCIRVGRTSGTTNTGARQLFQTLETADSVRFAGQTVTMSFYARVGANYSQAGSQLNFGLTQGTGTDQIYYSFTGATGVLSGVPTLTTSWQRFTATGTVATNTTQLAPYFSFSPTGTAGAADYFEVTGLQLEVGSVATPFNRMSGTIQGELAACQRYYTRINAGSVYTFFCNGNAYNTTVATCILPLPVTLRVSATSIDTSGTASHYRLINGSTATACSVVPALDQAATQSVALNFTVASGLTTGQAINAGANNTASAYIGVNAEL